MILFLKKYTLTDIFAVALITNTRGTDFRLIRTASVRDKCNGENGGQSILFQK